MLDYNILSFVIGLLLGFMYGLSFVVQKRKALPLFLKKFKLNHPDLSVFIKSISFFLIRISFLGIILYYLLPIKWINFILVALGFLIAFWAVILKTKASFYEAT